MVLVDTSSWIHWLRPKGDEAAKARVVDLLQRGEACWCPMVKLELWNGAGGDHEKKVLRELEVTLPLLPISDAVWSDAYQLVQATRTVGVTVPATDALIAACAHHHGATVEHSDGDFAQLAKVQSGEH